VIVEGVNVKKRHTKARKQGGKGEIVEQPHPVHVSNVRVA
jgi:ribosomal protein L24